MNKKIVIAIICVCVLVLTVGLGLYMRQVQTAAEVKGGLTLEIDGKSATIPLIKLDQTAFEGETVNGKGDRSTHAYRGVELKNLLADQKMDVSAVKAVVASSADQYTAELTGDEIREDGRVYVVVEMDGEKLNGIDAGTQGAQLVVFGDQNSRRNVRFLSIIQISTK